MDAEKLKSFGCPLEATLSMIGGKYKLIIIFLLIERTLRYSQLQRELPQASPKMLAQQLKELEKSGLINRKLYPVVPPKTEYSLTELGRSLVPIILDIYEWGERLYTTAGVESPCSEVDLQRMRRVVAGLHQAA